MTADDGYFRRESALYRVQEQRRVGLLFGQRALMLGATKPLNFIGSTRDARGRREPFNRLKDTGVSFETVFFDVRAVVDRLLANVAQRHSRVRGVLTEAAGTVPAGTRWAADDPESMLWTIAVAMDSAEVLYELLVGPLGPAGRQGLWGGYRRFAMLFGVPADVLPETYSHYRGWFDAELAAGDLFLTDEALYFGRAVGFQIPMPRAAEVTVRPLHNLVIAGSLQPRIRDLYKLRWSARDQARFELAVQGIRRLGRVLPNAVLVGRNTRAFEVVARTESRRQAAGRHTPHLPPLACATNTARAHAVRPLAARLEEQQSHE